MLRKPEISKGSGILTMFKIDPAWPIGDYIYLGRLGTRALGRIQKLLHRVASKVIPICLLASRKTLIEVRVLLESNAFFVLETAEIPKNFCQI